MKIVLKNRQNIASNNIEKTTYLSNQFYGSSRKNDKETKFKRKLTVKNTPLISLEPR